MCGKDNIFFTYTLYGILPAELANAICINNSRFLNHTYNFFTYFFYRPNYYRILLLVLKW